jgi:hypothetical protein
MSFVVIKGCMPHNMCGQVLAELGLAGMIAFGSIFWGVARNTREARRIVRFAGPFLSGDFATDLPQNALRDLSFAWQTVAATGAAVLLLAIMGWGFNFLFWHVWLWFGGFQVVALQCLQRQAECVETLAADEYDGLGT